MKTRWVETLGVVGICLLAVACGDSGASADEGTGSKEIERVNVAESPFKPEALESSIDKLVGALKDTDADSFDVAVVTKPFGGYWEPVKTGANRAMAELELSGEVVAPADANDSSVTVERQIDLVKERRETGYGGIALAPMEDKLTDEINAAVKAGMPVVTIDSDLAESNRQLYVGTNNREAGKTSGETLASLITETSGTVLILGQDTDEWPDGFARSDGARKALEAAGYDVTIRKVGWTEEDAAADVEYLTERIQNADPPVVGMLGMFSNAYRNAQVVESLGIDPGEIKIVAFDFEPDTLSYMNKGYIQATHAQRQYYMGYLVPYALYSIRVLGLDKTTDILGDHMIDAHRFDTGVDVVAAEQVDDYNDFLDSLGVGG